MVCELDDVAKVAGMFGGWQDTLVWSCLQKVMGKVYVTDLAAPTSAFAFAGGFGFFAGEPCAELVAGKPKGFAILVPPNDQWAQLIEAVHPSARKVTRYALRRDTRFDVDALKRNVQMLPDGYELRPIDRRLYDECLQSRTLEDFVCAFGSWEAFAALGFGVVALRDDKIVSGASSYSRYDEGIEVEVITVESERRRRLALVCCSALILRCLEVGLYPSWDARNMASVRLAQKLGYELDHEYVAYEVV